MEMFIFLSECRAEYATEYRAGSRVSVHSFIQLDENDVILSRIQLMDKLIFNVSFYINWIISGISLNEEALRKSEFSIHYFDYSNLSKV